MKRFCLKWWLFWGAGLCVAAASVLCFVKGHRPWGVLLLILLGFVAAGQWRLVMRLANLMKVYVAGLEVNDHTMCVDIGGEGSELRGMSDSMNRLTEIYRSSNMELETRKLYYDRILRVMTHEMRNSITPVIALAQDMKKRGDKYDAESASEALEVILSQSCGIKRFLDSYYQLTHLPDPKLEMLDASGFFDRMKCVGSVECKRLGLGEDVLEISVANGLRMNADEDLLARAVGNLVKNALEAVAGKESPEVRIMAAHVDGGIGITITDNGCGFASGGGEGTDMLFQPFYTTKAGGTGVGLCLSRQIARLHGGDLRLLNTSGNGSTMLLTIKA